MEYQLNMQIIMSGPALTNLNHHNEKSLIIITFHRSRISAANFAPAQFSMSVLTHQRGEELVLILKYIFLNISYSYFPFFSLIAPLEM